MLADADARHHGRAIEFDDQEQRFDRGLPLLEILLGPGKLLDMVRGILEVTIWRPRGKGIGSSKARDQSATMQQPRRANVSATMIDSSCSNVAIRQRIALIAAERNPYPSETKALMTGHRIGTYQIGQAGRRNSAQRGEATPAAEIHRPDRTQFMVPAKIVEFPKLALENP